MKAQLYYIPSRYTKDAHPAVQQVCCASHCAPLSAESEGSRVQGYASYNVCELNKMLIADCRFSRMICGGERLKSLKLRTLHVHRH